jgi:CO/xanthine dehydrogenase FAD-binding subunit
MKPAPFDYVAPSSLEEAVQALVAANGDGKIMAGGQSLMPLLNFRMARPSVVVDLRKILGLSFIDDRGSTIVIGALTRHADLERSDVIAAKLPVMAAAMPHVAHLAIRNRGTIGGSIAHADPAAEHPMLAVFYDAKIRAQGPNGRREISAEALFCGALITSLEPDEIVRLAGARHGDGLGAAIGDRHHDMVLKILPDTRQITHKVDAKWSEVGGRTDA